MRLIGVIAAAASVLSLAACSTSHSSTPPPTGTTAPSIVGDPLDMSQTIKNPCTMLRADQLAQFHLAAPGTPSGATGCAWTPTDDELPGYQASLTIGGDGLTAIYAERARLAVFQPTTVSEYPAVRTAASKAALSAGRCTVDVGVANDTLLSVNVTVPAADQADYTDPCDPASQLAAAIIANSEGQAP